MNALRAGVIYATANAASVAVPFLLLPLLTRVLSPDEYGHVIAFSMLVTLCLPFAGLNVHAAIGVGWFNRPRDDMATYVGAALSIAIFTTLAVATVTALILSHWPYLLGSSLSGVWGAAAALTAGASLLLQCRLVLWQSQQKPLQNAVLQIAASLLNVGLSLVAVIGLSWGGAGRNVGIVISAVTMGALACGLLLWSGDARWSMRRDHLRDLIAYGAPLIPHVLTGVMLGTADRWLISAALGAHALGIYGAGAQLGMMMSLLADAFVKAYSPWLYTKLAADDPDARYAVVAAIYAAVPAFMVAAAVLGLILHVFGSILLGQKYAAAVGLLPWFMLGGAFTGIYMCTSSIFFFFERTGLLAMILFAASVIGTTITWQLIARLGITGAAIGYAITQGLLAMFVTITAMRTFDLPWFEMGKSLKQGGGTRAEPGA